MAFIIRPITPWDDMAQLRILGKLAWRSGHEHLFTEEEVTQVMAAQTDDVFTFSWVVPKTGATFLALDGPTMVGAVTLRPTPSKGGYGLVEPMSVLPGRQ